MTGLLTGIARREKSRAPMEEVGSAQLSPERGLAGDCKGLKFPKRQVTLLSRALWESALFVLGNPPLHWTARRANLLVENIHLPRGRGSRLQLGHAILEVTGETTPCARMDEMWPGLRRALADDGRGGVTCRIVEGGLITIGDELRVLREVAPHKVHLPG